MLDTGDIIQQLMRDTKVTGTDISLLDLVSVELTTMAVKDIDQFRRIGRAMVIILQALNT